MNNNYKPPHYAFVIVACCCLMMGVNVGFSFSCAGIFYKPVSYALGVSIGEFGLYMSIMYIASAIMLPFAGKLLQRFSARILFSAASLLNAISFLALGCVSSLWQVYLISIPLGISIAFLLYMSYPTLINRWFHTRMGLMIGICCAASGIGGVVFNPFGAWIISSFGWRMGYWIFGAVVLLIVTPLLAILLRDNPADKGLAKFGMDSGPSSNSADNDGVSVDRAKRMPAFYAIIIFAFLMMGCSTLNLFIPGFAEWSGFSLEQASLAASASMFGVTLGKLLLGYINDRNCRLGVTLCSLGGAAGILTMVVANSLLPALLAGSFFFGWCYAGVTVQTAMLTKTVMGNRDYARIYAMVSIALSAGGAIASGGWGLLVDSCGFVATFIICAIFLVVAFILGFFALHKPQSPTKHPG